jgi:hypothetical protein
MMQRKSAGLHDFSADRHILALAAMALIVGTAGAGTAWTLLHFIAFATNLAYFGKFSADSVSIADNTLGLASVLVPAWARDEIYCACARARSNTSVQRLFASGPRPPSQAVRMSPVRKENP